MGNLTDTYTLSRTRTRVYSAGTGHERSISEIGVMRMLDNGNAVGWYGHESNGLYAYQWNCDSRWTVVDNCRSTLVADESAARDMLATALAQRGH